MTDRTDKVFFEDSFSRAEGTDLGNNWTGNGGLQIDNHSCRQLGASTATTAVLYADATTLASDMGKDYVVMARLAVDDDANSPEAYIRLRYDNSEDEGYKVGLKWEQSGGAELLTLYIKKEIDGVLATLTSSDVTAEANVDANSSYIDQYQTVRARIYSIGSGVVIEARLNNNSEPALSYTDNEIPTFGGSGEVGIEFIDNVSAVDGAISLDYIAIQGFQGDHDAYAVQPTYWTFGRIKAHSRAMALRDSSSAINDEEWGIFVNEAVQELFGYVGQPLWAEEVYTFRLGASQDEVLLPPDALDLDNIVLDTTSGTHLNIVSERSYRAEVGDSTSGTPYLFRLGGGEGSLILRPYPTPSQAGTYTVRYYRAPRYMLDDTEIPEIPQHYCSGISWGAVLRYSSRDGVRTLIQQAGRMWSNHLTMVRKRERKRGSRTENFLIGSGLHSPRSGRTGTVFDHAKYGIRR